MKGAVIKNVIKVVLENILLELYFNVKYPNEKKSAFHLGINDDGETIFFNEIDRFIELADINYEDNMVDQVKKNNEDEVAKLLEKEIVNIQFGVGKTLDTNIEVVYYVKIDTEDSEFLFFNNGDEGKYSFDNIKEILANDIYNIDWFNKIPAIRS